VIRGSEDAPLRLSYERRGRGEPLLLIHGAGSIRRAWDPVLDRLAVERDVIAVDLPGHGGSPLMEEVTSPTPQNFARLMVVYRHDWFAAVLLFGYRGRHHSFEWPR